uniref:Olfactory receptor 136 n=1 Tax=Aulacocentrum confusum TaxID=2767324 RepID=A0A7G8Z9F5_9HYME|nr:olfactory receptor 136 [Aulacocentrum confusum]
MYGAIVIMNTAAISFTGFEVVVLLERKQYTQVFRFIVFGLGQTLHLFLNSLPGQELLDYCEEEINIIYNCNWTSLSTRNKKSIEIILMRMFKPCTLAAGGFYVMNLENFGSVMQTSMSYLMVLASVH